MKPNYDCPKCGGKKWMDPRYKLNMPNGVFKGEWLEYSCATCVYTVKEACEDAR